MPEVALSHIFGTIGLLVLLGAIGLSSSYITQYYSNAAASSQLNDIAEYVASQMVTAASISSESTSPSLSFSLNLSIPVLVNSNGYAINVTYVQSTNATRSVQLTAYLTRFTYVKGQASVMVNNQTSSGPGTVLIQTTTTPFLSGYRSPRVNCTKGSSGVIISLVGG